MHAGGDCLGQCLYVSGVPGTGKTATALEVVRGLRRRAAAGQLPAFRFVELNALRLPSPQHAYCVLVEVHDLLLSFVLLSVLVESRAQTHETCRLRCAQVEVRACLSTFCSAKVALFCVSP